MVEEERGEAIGGQGVSRSRFFGDSGVQAPGVMDRLELRGAGDDVDVLLTVCIFLAFFNYISVTY